MDRIYSVDRGGLGPLLVAFYERDLCPAVDASQLIMAMMVMICKYFFMSHSMSVGTKDRRRVGLT